ncbi:WD40-repeat-containing domain protein [Cladochytrium replicatum]|nr:WD40-repeat-containing domain protein [Cladochytrium replicatum]
MGDAQNDDDAGITQGDRSGVKRANFNSDVLNIHHFEELQKTFHEHRNDDGSSGFSISKFREVFGNVLGGGLNYDQMTMLFMKIDANSDGTVDWDEFSTYMISGAMEDNHQSAVFDERIKKVINCPHKDMIKRIDFIAKERKYISVSREGTVCLWAPNFKLQRVINTQDIAPKEAWVTDALFMHDQGRLVTITDDRQLCIYDILSIKPRIVAIISQLEGNPLCLAYAPHYDDDRDLILFGDDGGHLNVLSITRKMIFENTSDADLSEPLTAAKLSKKEAWRKYSMSFYKRKIHNEWVLKVQYYAEMNAFVSCASENSQSLVIGDLERKAVRLLNVPKGIKCFDYCRRPSFLVTGGRDKIIRLWNPYVLSKPAGSLHGHSTAVVNIIVNNEEGHVISLSEDKVIKIWNARNLNCLQTITDKIPRRPENILSAIFFDSYNSQLITGSNKLEKFPLYKNPKHTVARSHDTAIVAALFNSNFHQVVSGCQNGTVSIWDIATGEKIFQFHNVHGKHELTAMCYDHSGRRLITGSRDGVMKMWNFNNGQLLRRLMRDETSEITDGLNRYIVGVGWDKSISIYLDDPNHFEHFPVRELNGQGTVTHRGHNDDLSSVAFCPPNVLASSSVDGAIVIWNLESGCIKLTMREPFIDFRSTEEKAVEKLNCQVVEDEGLTTMTLNMEATMIIVGCSKGHILLIDVDDTKFELCDDSLPPCAITKTWQAHLETVTSVNYVHTQNIILTASSDSTIRVWHYDGTHIGIFGQDEPWNIHDRSTYALLPMDLYQESLHEKQRAELLAFQKEMITKDVFDTWKGKQFFFLICFKLMEKLKRLEKPMGSQRMLRLKNVRARVLRYWREFCLQRKFNDDWVLSPDLLTVKSSRGLFSFHHRKSTKTPLRHRHVRHDAVFHLLECHPLEEISQPKVAPKFKNHSRADNKKAPKIKIT